MHNTQPWRFRLTEHTIELHTDPGRRLPVADPNGTKMRLSCGAALFNLRMAVGGLGIRPIVTAFPDRDQPELIAVVRRGGYKRPTLELERLLRAIPLRRTNTGPLRDSPVVPARAARSAPRRARRGHLATPRA